ncbi:hypothetical protein TIFTF001_012029 [Ficus carica]|uniref:Uncharacterized protein n=1 Tax=Ficus carica TaxID=3494 RepID=A0AA87ZZD0_FICCA|nr:hypothetical protein TIFTF001_012029 [Ficus carica]
MGTVAVRREIQIPTLAEVIAIANMQRRSADLPMRHRMTPLRGHRGGMRGRSQFSPARRRSHLCAQPPRRHESMALRWELVIKDRCKIGGDRGLIREQPAIIGDRSSSREQPPTVDSARADQVSELGVGLERERERERERTVLRDRRSGEERRRMIKS